MKYSIATLEKPCSGCGACTAVCPTTAISLSSNPDGFITAHVDDALCVGCGKCLAVCNRHSYKKNQNIHAGRLFAMQSTDASVVNSCTSGGIAFELAIKGYQAGKKVVGTIYDYETNRARMIIAQSEEDIERMKGSKYLQSDVGDCAKEVCRIAKEDPAVQFIIFGTPCQIYGFDQLANQLGFRERCLLVDLFCHGVPSYLVWELYLESMQKKTSIVNWDCIRFRDSRVAWHDFVLSFETPNVCISENSEKSAFYHVFFDNVLLSAACFNCNARCYGSGSDIRLGDYWGKRYSLREDGVSAVLCLTQKGEKEVSDHERMRMLTETSVEEALVSQSMKPYDNMELQAFAFKTLKTTRDIRKTIRLYRRHFVFKKRLKLFVKEAIGYLPAGLRKVFKRVYRMI